VNNCYNSGRWFALTYAERRNLALILLAAFIAILLLTACGTPIIPCRRTSPFGKNGLSTCAHYRVHPTESDHRQLQQSQRLGGELHAVVRTC